MSQNTQEFASDLFLKKKQRRRQVASLTFEEKIEILVRLQNLASEISLQARGTCRKPWWDPDAPDRK